MTKDEALLMIEKAELTGNLNDLVLACDACKEALEQPTEQPTRLEVIDADGRTYTNCKVKELQFSYQDNGKTLKIFVTEVQDDTTN